jgi:DNA-binding transcriptional MerR regulator
MNGFTIGRLAKQVGIDIETLRFHERRNLIYLTAK